MSPLVRLPDQFRPERGTSRPATPSCGCACCCCCCCVASVVTTSVVLPLRVEIAARRSTGGGPGGPEGAAGATPDRATLRRAKALAVLAPLAATGIGVAGVNEELPWAPAAGLAVFVALLAWAYSPYGASWRAFLPAVVFGAAFTVELFAGAFLVLTTAGIGYLLAGGLVSALVIRHQLKALQRWRTG